MWPKILPRLFQGLILHRKDRYRFRITRPLRTSRLLLTRTRCKIRRKLSWLWCNRRQSSRWIQTILCVSRSSSPTKILYQCPQSLTSKHRTSISHMLMFLLKSLTKHLSLRAQMLQGNKNLMVRVFSIKFPHLRLVISKTNKQQTLEDPPRLSRMQSSSRVFSRQATDLRSKYKRWSCGQEAPLR